MTVWEYLQVFRKRWRIVVVGLVLGLVAAGGATLLRSPEYSAEATIVVLADLQNADLTSILDGNQLAISRMTTYGELVRSNRLAGEVAARLGPDVSAEDVANAIFTIARPDTTLITVTAADASPVRAARIANLVAEQFVADVAVIEQRPGGSPLVRAQVFEKAAPAVSASSPRPRFDLLVGAVLGLVVGFGSALVLDARATLSAPTTPGRRPG